MSFFKKSPPMIDVRGAADFAKIPTWLLCLCERHRRTNAWPQIGNRFVLEREPTEHDH